MDTWKAVIQAERKTLPTDTSASCIAPLEPMGSLTVVSGQVRAQGHRATSTAHTTRSRFLHGGAVVNNRWKLSYRSRLHKIDTLKPQQNWRDNVGVQTSGETDPTGHPEIIWAIKWETPIHLPFKKVILSKYGWNQGNRSLNKCMKRIHCISFVQD